MIKKQGTILIVDDNRNILTTVRMLLEPIFDGIITIANPNSIPAKLREEHPDVVLLDMNFSSGINSGNEGLYWLREIKSLSPKTEVVLFTAYADIQLAVTGIKEGAADFIVKPFEIEKMTDKRIKYECNPENSGAAITRNNALRRAKGRWIAFLDSDDLWSPEKLEKQLAFMVKNDYHFSYTVYEEMDESSKLTGVKISGPKHVTKLGMFSFCWPGCLTVMFEQEHIGLLQIADIKKNNDYAMWLKVIQKADCYLLDECLAKYRRGRKGSVSTASRSRDETRSLFLSMLQATYTMPQQVSTAG